MDFIVNKGLFTQSVLDTVSQDTNNLYISKTSINQAEKRLKQLISYWSKESNKILSPLSKKDKTSTRHGIPEKFTLSSSSESDIEQGLIRTTLEIIGFEHKIANNISLKGKDKADRPDMILFNSDKNIQSVNKALANNRNFDGRKFCLPAVAILEAKKTSESTENIKHIKQIHDYLSNYNKEWGILSNGLSWRLSHKSDDNTYLRFDLVLFLQQFTGKQARKPSAQDIHLFALFEHLFGSNAHSSSFLTDLYNETEKATANLRETLKQNAHNAVEKVATGFWLDTTNRQENWIKTTPSQEELDDLREKSLIILYRLLFILKAESRQLLKKEGAYLDEYALSTLLTALEGKTPEQLTRSTIYKVLKNLFHAIDKGSTSDSIPAYNGGLFDADIHTDLVKWQMTDGALQSVLTALMYAGEAQKKEIVWKELDVRDLGDVYEGLLEQRLILETDLEIPELYLKNEKGERKSSGSYFTPDSIVTQVANATLLPLLDSCKDDPNKILNLRILDPAMGSGHFLVKVIDVMSHYLTMHCNPQHLEHPDKGIKNTDDAIEQAYWKRKIVESCIYGVDYNPMSVELAKVALWLHTAEYGKPLSFLSHHLKVGNSLLGANVDELKEPALEAKQLKSGTKWQAKKRSKEVLKNKRKKASTENVPLQLDLDLFFIDENIISGVLENIRDLLASNSSKRKDIEVKRKKYQHIVNELAAHKLLADLWCAQWFFVEPNEQGIKAFGTHGNSLYNQLLRICNIKDSKIRQSELDKFRNNSFVKQIRANTEHGYGARPTLFFHWQLEFPEVAFDAKGQPKGNYGFDAVLGNPPWDKIKPETKHFYAPYSSKIASTQGTSIKKVVHQLELKHSHLHTEWLEYENTIKKTVLFLKESEHYHHQSTFVAGKKTGGDPDLFRFFIERAYQCTRTGGRVGFVTPAGLWQAEGCTALRQLLLQRNQLEQLYTFENFRKWAFNIDTRFKFSTFVFKKLAENKTPKATHSFKSGFMLRHDNILNEKPASLRLMNLSVEKIKAFSPDTLALLDFKSAGDSVLVSKLHENFSALGKSDWDIKYRRELDMSNDAYLFKKPQWMAIRGFSGLKSADADFYEKRGYEIHELELKNDKKLSVYLHPDDKKIAEDNPHLNASHFYIIPDETYVPLYEGRMVHIFDHCQKKYLEGEGRTAKWGTLGFDKKTLKPRVYVSMQEAQVDLHPKLGFCDVTGATNERSTLTALLSEKVACGHSVPTFTFKEESIANLILLNCLMNSFVFDFLIRFRVSLHLTMNFLTQVPVPQLADIDETLKTELCERVVKLSCTTEEMATYWNHVYPDTLWTKDSAERDLNKRATLRAEIDARIAKLYQLNIEDYARILTHFPLLDRSFEPLEGDKFVAEGTAEEKTDRAFITRDLALHTYLLYLREQDKDIVFIDDLEKFYREKVKIDPTSEESRFRIGDIKDLELRVNTAIEKGAIAYVPS